MQRADTVVVAIMLISGPESFANQRSSTYPSVVLFSSEPEDRIDAIGVTGEGARTRVVGHNVSEDVLRGCDEASPGRLEEMETEPRRATGDRNRLQIGKPRLLP